MIPILSVIIPIYNSEQYLEKCVRSVMASSLRDLEIILVDDGSTDSSGILCDQLTEKDGRIRVLHQLNTGVSAARNNGLKIAKGIYFAFVDADDYIEPDMYEKMITALEKNAADLACCGFCREYDDKTGIRETYCNYYPKDTGDMINTLRRLISVSSFGTISTSVANKVGKRTIQMENSVFFDESLYECEDGVFWCDYIISIKKAVFLENIFYHYVIHGENVTSNWKINKSKLSNLIAWNHIIQTCTGLSKKLGCTAKMRYQIYLRKMIFNSYCVYGYNIEVKKLIPQLKFYRKEMYLSDELPISKKIYYFVCGGIVKYNFGKKMALTWKNLRDRMK